MAGQAVDNRAVLDHVTASAVLVEKVAEAHAKETATREKVASLIPGVVQALVDGERIEDTEYDRADMARAMTDHVAAIGLIQKLAKHRNAKEKDDASLSLGQPEGGHGKSASRNQPGARSAEVPESSRKFAEVFGFLS